MRSPSLPLFQFHKFQSAPDREVGRCKAFDWLLSIVKSFQSAPDREVGRCIPVTRDDIEIWLVSIRARP